MLTTPLTWGVEKSRKVALQGERSPLNIATNADATDKRREVVSGGAIRDVCLSRRGELSLRLVDLAGRPVPNVSVAVGFKGSVIAQATSDGSGRIHITGLRPGVHTVAAGFGSGVYRLWTAHTAPPDAIHHPAVVVDADIARGQYGPMMGYPMQPMMGPGMMAPGLLATTVTAAAVAAVVIGKNSSSGSSSSPASP